MVCSIVKYLGAYFFIIELVVFKFSKLGWIVNMWLHLWTCVCLALSFSDSLWSESSNPIANLQIYGTSMLQTPLLVSQSPQWKGLRALQRFIFKEESRHLSCIIFCSNLALTLLLPAPMFLVTVTMLQPCSDVSDVLVTLSQPSRCSNLAPTFLVSPSQYYNFGHSLL